MASPWRSIVATTLRWAAAWAVVGLLAGLLMMFGKVPPIAEPGAPNNVGFYSFWIPLCLGVASVFGLLLGLIYSCLMEAMELWRLRSGIKPGFEGTYGRRMVCGAMAGGLIGFPAIPGKGALVVVGLGIASALVSGYANRQKPGSLQLEPHRNHPK